MKILLLTFVIGVVAAATESPVLLGGADSPALSALSTIQNEKFAEILSPLSKNHMILAFQENGLSTHDFSCKQNRSEPQTCFAHLSSVSPKTFYSRVTNVDKSLETIDPNYNVISISKNGKLETPLKCKVGKVATLRFSNDADVTRADTLEAHDYIIANIMKQMSCPTVLLYTSAPVQEVAANKRTRRALSPLETAAPKGGIIFTDSKFQIFYTKLAVTPSGGTTKEITIGNMSVTSQNTSDFTVTLTSSDNTDTITFNIELLSGYYYMKQLTYNKNTQYRTTDINAPPAFSYYCGNLTVYSTGGDTLLWNSLQFQAPFGSKVKTVDDKYFEFGESWNCVGFVTPPILAGLFVAFILLGIIFTGICWMMDINTMDRFDDPKGKTITINTLE